MQNFNSIKLYAQKTYQRETKFNVSNIYFHGMLALYLYRYWYQFTS